VRTTPILAAFAAFLIAAGAHPGAAAADEFTDFFAFGPGSGTRGATSDVTALVVPSFTTVNPHIKFSDGCCGNLTVTVIAPDGTVVFDAPAFSGNLGTYSTPTGCPHTWRVRVRTTNGRRPSRKVAGAVAFDFTPPDAALSLKLKDDKISLDPHTASTDRVLEGCTSFGPGIQQCSSGLLTIGEGHFLFEAKWHSDPFSTFNDFRKLTVSLVSPNGTVVRSDTGFSKHAPSDKTPKLNFIYPEGAADASQSGSWKLRVTNDSPVRIVDFNIQSSFDSLLDSGVPSFHSDYVPICSEPVGGFDVLPANATVPVRHRQRYAFTWVVPGGGSWHDLDHLELRIRDARDTALWLRFNVGDGSFAVYDEKAGTFRHRKRHAHTPFVTIDLARSSVATSSPTGPRVTLDLPLRVKRAAAGRTFDVEVAATDKNGTDTGFLPAGTLVVPAK
jgi:hypothetical protein